MTEDAFWSIIEDTRRIARGESAAEHAKVLVETLAAAPVDYIVSFSQWFQLLMDRAETWLLMAAYGLIHDGCHSEDGFECFRAWLIGRGRERFEELVADPDCLAEDLPDEPNPPAATEGEDLLWAAQNAIRTKVGEEVLDRDPDLYDRLYEPPPDAAEVAAAAATTPDEGPIKDEDAAARLPRLAARTEAIWSRDAERPRNIAEAKQPDGSTVFYYPSTLRVTFALGPDGRPIRGIGDIA
jgi:hypothetical protein